MFVTPADLLASAQPGEGNPLMGDFRDFVSKERERLEKKKAALAKKEKDARLAELKQWGDNFKLKTPSSGDGAAASAGSAKNASGAAQAADKPRDPSAQKSLSPQTVHANDSSRPTGGERASGTSSMVPSPKVAPRLLDAKVSLAGMTIPKIPPFNAAAAKKKAPPGAASASTSPQIVPVAATASPVTSNAGAAAASTKLSAKASSFKPFNPAAAAFTPGGAAAAKKPDAVRVPDRGQLYAHLTKARCPLQTPPAVPQAPLNPFFGARFLKRPTAQSPIHVREDFNPFKNGKVPEAPAVGEGHAAVSTQTLLLTRSCSGPVWGFTGKPYRQLFSTMPPVGPAGMGMGPQVPVAGFDESAVGMQPAGMPHPQQMGQPGGPHPPPHMAQGPPGSPMPPGQGPAQAGQMQGPPHSGPPGAPAPGQPFGMVYQPYGPYRFHGQVSRLLSRHTAKRSP
jgi:hypothetical protein